MVSKMYTLFGGDTVTLSSKFGVWFSCLQIIRFEPIPSVNKFISSSFLLHKKWIKKGNDFF